MAHGRRRRGCASLYPHGADEQRARRAAAGGQGHDALATGDLSGVDEFHTGWRPLTLALARELAPPPGTRLLDVGAGIGGPARHFAEAYGCDVTGIDLTPAFVDLATELTERTGLAGRVRFVTGSALAMPFQDDAFDLATMFHVGMNIADKPALFAEVRGCCAPAAASSSTT